MTTILKTIAAGILAGAALFMIPFFLIKILIFFLLIKAVFRLLGWRRHHWRMHPAYVNRCGNMTEEERKAFTEKYGRSSGYYRGDRTPENENKQ
jgi:hypothetical protein